MPKYDVLLRSGDIITIENDIFSFLEENVQFINVVRLQNNYRLPCMIRLSDILAVTMLRHIDTKED